MVGNTETMNPVFQRMLKAAHAQEPVLITGETGTGKELVARSIHQLAQTADSEFVTIDCCTLAPNIIESELFGHMRGAFTGAMARKQGLFEVAGTGTVFLDEIAELPLDLQGKLLRAIQEKEVRPVGSTAWIQFEARLIAATNIDLELAVQRGTFRKDLYYRLNVVSIYLPPLRERKEDIPALAAHFLAGANSNPHPPRLSPECLDYLLAYHWPGNVRELENCIRRAVALCSNGVIRPEDLGIGDQTTGELEVANGSLQELQRQAILKMLQRTQGDKLLAARLLGIGKTTLYRKLKEYSVSTRGLQ